MSFSIPESIESPRLLLHIPRQGDWLPLQKSPGQGLRQRVGARGSGDDGVPSSRDLPISQIYSEYSFSIELAKAVGATMEGELDFRGAAFRIYLHPH